MGETDVDLWLWSTLACISVGKVVGAIDAPVAVGVFCVSLKLGKSCPDPVNGEEERNQGNRQTIGCIPVWGLGMDAHSWPCPRHWQRAL